MERRRSSRKRRSNSRYQDSPPPSPPPSPSPRKKKSTSSRRGGFIVEEDDDPPRTAASRRDEDNGDFELALSQKLPSTACEFSQSLPPPRETEKQRLDRLNPTTAARAVTSLARLLLFQALGGKPVDRKKCVDDALEGTDASGISKNALLEAAEQRLSNVWGYRIQRTPDFMTGSLPPRYSDRYYVINKVTGDTDGRHSKAIHNQIHTSVEKGLLMVVLALSYCKGTPVRSTSKNNENANNTDSEKDSIYTARWIQDVDLFRLLHDLDETIPEEPPSAGMSGSSKRKSTGTGSTHPHRHFNTRADKIVMNVEEMLERFVAMDYLVRDKSANVAASGISQTESQTAAVAELVGFSYAMGPRAALEIGRRQLVYFCADILDEQPDPLMLEEIKDGLREQTSQETEEEEQ